MSSSKFTLSRRTLLRGALGGGALACIGLPVLDAMLDSHGEALADGAALPKRLMTWFFGNGVRLDRFVPANEGANYTLSSELAPLADVKDYCAILSGRDNKAGYPKITHHEGMACFSGHPMAEQSGLFSKAGGPTIDQVAASLIGTKTTFASLEVGVSRMVSKNEGSTMQFLSHKSTNEPLPPEYDPSALFARVFASFTPGQAKTVALRVSVLDAIREDTNRLRQRVGAHDRVRIDSHLEGINALQKQIKALPPVCSLPPAPTETNVAVGGAEPIGSTARAMADLLVYAFACDLTRVASYMFTGGVGATVFRELSFAEEHHILTHTTDFDSVHRGIVYTMENFAYLIKRMKATPDGTNKNLLDNSVVFCGSDCAEGFTHSVYDQPIIVAGRGGGALRYPAVHHRSTTFENTADALLSCVRTVAPQVTSVGSKLGMSTTPCAALAPA
jgi:Protein of unknown function (DUF1552)